MLIQVEEKAQGWRALAVYANGDEVLLFVGRSSTQCRGRTTIGQSGTWWASDAPR